MKVILDSYPLAMQNDSGGIQVRLKQYMASLINDQVNVELFDKWNHKLVGYDIYHLFKVTVESYSTLLYARKKGIKIVISAVIPIDKKNQITISLFLASKFRLFLPHEAIRRCLSLADVITTETEQEKQFICANYKIDEDKILVIPNGVNNIFLASGPLSVSFKKVFNVQKPYILQVGRIDRNKNQLRVIKALRNTDIPIIFIGGPDSNELSYFEECKQALGENMVMTGWIPHDSDLIISAYRDAKVVILPSIYETFGNVLIEGGVSGTNIACSETLALNEYPISRFWSKFNPLDVKSIKENILFEYNKSIDHKMREEFIATFSWDKIIKRYIDIYTKLYEVR